MTAPQHVENQIAVFQSGRRLTDGVVRGADLAQRTSCVDDPNNLDGGLRLPFAPAIVTGSKNGKRQTRLDAVFGTLVNSDLFGRDIDADDLASRRVPQWLAGGNVEHQSARLPAGF